MSSGFPRSDSAINGWDRPRFAPDTTAINSLNASEISKRPGDLFRFADEVRSKRKPEKAYEIKETEHFGKLKSW